MYFSSAFVLAALPFLVGAIPVQNSARSVLSIPLSKRSTLRNTDEVVNLESLQAGVHHIVASVFPVIFF
jgi:cathepsin D